MIYKTVSIKQVIAKVLTDNNIQEETHKISDMISWAAEALERIGAFPQFETHVTGKEGAPLIELANYQAQLPNGTHKIIQVAYADNEKGPFYPMRYATGSFDANRGTTITNDGGITYTTENENPGITSFTSDFVYTVFNNYIKTNQAEGYLMIAYTSIPLDANGYPLVPDDISFIEALYWYITMKLMYPEWREGRIRDAVYYDARRSWNFYCKQAYGNALMPNQDQLEAIKNTWNRLVPELNDHNNFYSTTGQEQHIRNQTNGYGKGYPNIY